MKPNSLTPPPPPDFPITTVMQIVSEAMPAFRQPLIDQMGHTQQTPFRILVATILSLRTKDTLTAVVAPRLFAVADTPTTILALGDERLAELIYPVGFYRTKARSIIQICSILLDRYDGTVPADLDALLELPGVGRKTANLVMTAGFGLPGICVDIHVHRICNRWGYVSTKNPDGHRASSARPVAAALLDSDQQSFGDTRATYLPPHLATLPHLPADRSLRPCGRDTQPVADSR
jgi:endonuclease III